MTDFFTSPPLWALIVLVIFLFIQAVWIFNDAIKHGVNPWLWGIWALTSIPLPLIVYLIVERKIFRRKK